MDVIWFCILRQRYLGEVNTKNLQKRLQQKFQHDQLTRTTSCLKQLSYRRLKVKCLPCESFQLFHSKWIQTYVKGKGGEWFPKFLGSQNIFVQ